MVDYYQGVSNFPSKKTKMGVVITKGNELPC